MNVLQNPVNRVLNKLERTHPSLKKSALWGQIRFYNAPVQTNIPVKNAKSAPQLETIKDMKEDGFYNPGLPPMPNVGGNSTVNDNRQVTNNVNVTVNGADVDKNNLQYTLLDNINNATNLNAISDYSRRNRDDL